MSQPQAGTFWSDPAHFKPVTRREFLQVGFVDTVGLTLGDAFRLQSASATEPVVATPAADSVIMVFLAGGLSHLDSFDPKPYAPVEIRGSFGAIKTKLDGVQFSSLWSRTAGIADKLAVIRSMTHGEAAHERGSHTMLTGYKPSPAITYPSMGAVVSHELGPRNNLPGYISAPDGNQGFGFAGTGYLSAACGAFSVGGDPNNKNFVVRDLNLPAGVNETRMDRRKGLLAAVDQHFRSAEESDQLNAMDAFYQRAYGLISSKEAREAFNINAEPKEMRDRYGRNVFGQRLLLARRLVEGGARFVSVFHPGWDMHKDVHGSMRRSAPPVDQGLAALVTDLEQRGLLGRTMVMLTTEFGRTSRVNKDRGRDHWPKVFSVVMAGGGLRGGQVIGSSDADGAQPQNDPVSPTDVAATIFSQLGINPEKKLLAPGDRPIDIVRDGKVISALV